MSDIDELDAFFRPTELSPIGRCWERMRSQLAAERERRETAERERDDARANLKLRTAEVVRLRSGRLASLLLAAEAERDTALAKLDAARGKETK